jgi:hypothetical protein
VGDDSKVLNAEQRELDEHFDAELAIAARRNPAYRPGTAAPRIG